MRLIDADKLKKELEVNGLGYQYYMLDNAPTVEAIPKEWIEDYYTNITSPYTDTRIQFEEMIRKWEKENETN